MPDDDDRPSDASSAADASWAHPVVPDDISMLVADIEAYHRELRRERRAAWRGRVLSRPGVLPLTIVSVALVLAGVVATLLTAFSPGRSGPAALPLATRHTAQVGAVGGLIPQVTLLADGQRIQSPALRPSVVALVPVGCGCDALLDKLAGQAYGVNYPLNVVVGTGTDVAGLTKALVDGRTQVLTDPAYPSHPTASLYRQAGASGLTLLLVKANGVIYDRFRNVKSATMASVNADLDTMTTG